LDTPVIIQTSALAIKKPIQGKVFFDNVSLSYIQGNNVLNHISLEVEQDQIVALVGLSGAGKTSLLNLIPRFYDPTQGNVLIDGIDIKNFDIYSLRSQISFVLQEDILFAGTIFDNVRYGTPNATQEEVLTAVKQANAWEFIENLPKGLWSKVGDRGHKLSGGQKQRISIARAILRNPRILLLDEATSALDSQSEKWVQAALEKLMKNRTTFVIAHRLSTVIHAHKIVVLDAGCIVETGSHQELLSKNGHYAKLYQLQFQKTEKKLNPS
jgi:subfamily B ATP-binding cassette protein MsbA